MTKVLIFGAGKYYERKKEAISGQVIGYVDNYKTGDIDGIRIYNVNELLNLDFDYIYIMVDVDNVAIILKQIIEVGVPADKVILGQNLGLKTSWEKVYMKAEKPLIYEENRLIYNSGNVKVNISEAHELRGIAELLGGNSYGYEIGTMNNIVIDVGMNIGIASLYFAEREDVKCVYSYEPFKDTYDNAIKNISLNPDLEKKIVPVNAGISDRNMKEKILYNSCMHGALTTCKEFVDETLHYQKENNSYNEKTEKEVEIQLLDICEEVNKIVAKNKNNHLILKMDCEGSEYCIFERLESADMLKLFDCIMLEWHYRGSEKLKESLLNAGFGLFEMVINENYGLVNAVRKECL